MEIIPTQISAEEVKHEGTTYVRKAFNNGFISWHFRYSGMWFGSHHYKGPSPAELERLYQELINKPVTTTNEQPNLKKLYDFCKRNNLSVKEYYDINNHVPILRITVELQTMQQKIGRCNKGFEGCDHYKNDNICRCY